MNANVATQMITYFLLRLPVPIYMLLVIFFIRVFQNKRFNRFLRFFASLINNNGTLRKCYLFSCRYKNFWSIKSHWNVIKKKWLRVSRVKQDRKKNDFCPKRGQSLKASAAILHPNFCWVPHSHWAVREEHTIDKAVSARLSSKRIYW